MKDAFSVPDAKVDEHQSGSRLKAKYYVGADGSKIYKGASGRGKGSRPLTRRNHTAQDATVLQPRGSLLRFKILGP